MTLEAIRELICRRVDAELAQLEARLWPLTEARRAVILQHVAHGYGNLAAAVLALIEAEFYESPEA